MSVSVFDSSIVPGWTDPNVSNPTAGVVWRYTRTSGPADEDIVWAADEDKRAATRLPPSYVQGVVDAFVTRLIFTELGVLSLYLSPSFNSDSTSAGPELTDVAEANLGIIARASNSTIFARRISALISSDSSEPYEWQVGGDVREFYTALTTGVSAIVVLVDTSHANVDFANRRVSSATYVAPVVPTLPNATFSQVLIDAIPAGREGTTVQLSAASIDGTYDGTPTYRWSVQGGTLDDETSATPTWTRPQVTADRNYNVNLVIRVAGTGTIAANGTSKETNSPHVVARVEDTPASETDTDSIWQLAIAQPATPTDGTTTQTHTPSGWTRVQPDATSQNAVWRSQRTRTFAHGVFTSATAWGAPTETSPRTLVLANFDTSGLEEVVVLGAITSGTPESNGTVYRSTENGGLLGSLGAGADMDVEPNQMVTRIALNVDGVTGNVRFWDNPAEATFTAFFTDNPDVTLRMQFAEEGPAYEFTAGSQGSHFSNWNTTDTDAHAALTAALAAGRTFLFALAKTQLTVVVSGQTLIGAGTLGQATLEAVNPDPVVVSGGTITGAGTIGQATLVTVAAAPVVVSGSTITGAGTIGQATLVTVAAAPVVVSGSTITGAGTIGQATLVTVAAVTGTDTDSIWQLAIAQPATPTDGTTTQAHTPSGWTRVQPDPTSQDAVWRSQRTRTYSHGVFTSATAWGAPTETSPRTLVLANFDTSALEEVAVLGAIVSGTPEGNGTVYRNSDNGGPLGSLGAGSDMDAQLNQTVTRIALNVDGVTGNVRFWDTPGPVHLSAFFTDNPDVTLRMQFATEGPAYEFTPGSQGGNFSNWSTTDTDAHAALTAARASGRIFLFALAKTQLILVSGQTLTGAGTLGQATLEAVNPDPVVVSGSTITGAGTIGQATLVTVAAAPVVVSGSTITGAGTIGQATLVTVAVAPVVVFGQTLTGAGALGQATLEAVNPDPVVVSGSTITGAGTIGQATLVTVAVAPVVVFGQTLTGAGALGQATLEAVNPAAVVLSGQTFSGSGTMGRVNLLIQPLGTLLLVGQTLTGAGTIGQAMLETVPPPVPPPSLVRPPVRERMVAADGHLTSPWVRWLGALQRSIQELQK